MAAGSFERVPEERQEKPVVTIGLDLILGQEGSSSPEGWMAIEDHRFGRGLRSLKGAYQ